MTFSEFHKRVVQFRAEKHLETTVEKRSLFLVTEIGELTKEVLRLESASDGEARSAILKDLASEAYDVLWNFFDLLDLLNIDIEAAIEQKEQINKTRSWTDSRGEDKSSHHSP